MENFFKIFTVKESDSKRSVKLAEARRIHLESWPGIQEKIFKLGEKKWSLGAEISKHRSTRNFAKVNELEKEWGALNTEENNLKIIFSRELTVIDEDLSPLTNPVIKNFVHELDALSASAIDHIAISEPVISHEMNPKDKGPFSFKVVKFSTNVKNMLSAVTVVVEAKNTLRNMLADSVLEIEAFYSQVIEKIKVLVDEKPETREMGEEEFRFFKADIFELQHGPPVEKPMAENLNKQIGRLIDKFDIQKDIDGIKNDLQKFGLRG